MNTKLEKFKELFDSRLTDGYFNYYIGSNRLTFEFDYDVETILQVIEELVIPMGLSYSIKDHRILTVKDE